MNKAGVSNLLTILSAYTATAIDSLVDSFAGRMYGDLKKDVASAVLAFAEPFQNRVFEILGDRAELERVMLDGAERATVIAQETVADVYAKIGFAQS